MEKSWEQRFNAMLVEIQFLRNATLCQLVPGSHGSMTGVVVVGQETSFEAKQLPGEPMAVATNQLQLPVSYLLGQSAASDDSVISSCRPTLRPLPPNPPSLLHSLSSSPNEVNGSHLHSSPSHASSNTPDAITSTPTPLDDRFNGGILFTTGKRHLHPKGATNILRQWMLANLMKPYPTDEEKTTLCEATGLTLAQLNNWLSNARRRAFKREPTINQKGEGHFTQWIKKKTKQPTNETASDKLLDGEPQNDPSTEPPLKKPRTSPP